MLNINEVDEKKVKPNTSLTNCNIIKLLRVKPFVSGLENSIDCTVHGVTKSRT